MIVVLRKKISPIRGKRDLIIPIVEQALRLHHTNRVLLHKLRATPQALRATPKGYALHHKLQDTTYILQATQTVLRPTLKHYELRHKHYITLFYTNNYFINPNFRNTESG